MDPLVPINPKKPVAGNLSGTFAGFVAMLVAGSMSSHGMFAWFAALVTSDPVMSGQIESGAFVFVVALVGSLVNYGVTHFAQVKKLKDLYDALPTTYAEYPDGKNNGASK